MASVEEILDFSFRSIDNNQLQKALDSLKELFDQKPYLTGYDEYETICSDHNRMRSYMEQGFNDPKLIELYKNLLQRTYRLTSDLQLSWNCKNKSIYVKAFQTANHLNMSHEFIQTVLETYVTDIAMLSLSSNIEKNKQEEIYTRHQNFIEQLFCAVVVSTQWNKDDESFYEELLLSPTIDNNDQRVIIAAILLSCTNLYDFHKFRILFNIYLKSSDEYVKQRALVGWALILRTNHSLGEDVIQLVKRACLDKAVLKDLRSLQMQFFYSADAESDIINIQREIMPDLEKARHLRAGGLDISIQSEDKEGDIFHPNADEEEMEKVEKRIQQMGEMFKKGTDIYFAGFSQMKNFPIFDSLITWFQPFYINHPKLSNLRNLIGNNKFKDMLTQEGSFCESDKYSFACAIEQVYSSLPEELRKSMEEGGAEMMPIGGAVQEISPSFICRMFIQDLYRFFKLNPNRDSLINLFQDNSEEKYGQYIKIFLSEPLAKYADNQTKLKISFQYYKRDLIKESKELLSYVTDKNSDYYALRGHVLNNKESIACYKRALELNPDNIWAMEGLAERSVIEKEYSQAEQALSLLLQQHPENLDLALRYVSILYILNKDDKARELAYKLDFEYPDNPIVKCKLIYSLICSKQLDKALKEAESLLVQDENKKNICLKATIYLCMDKIAEAYNFLHQMISDGKITLNEIDLRAKENDILYKKCSVDSITIEIIMSLLHKVK